MRGVFYIRCKGSKSLSVGAIYISNGAVYWLKKTRISSLVMVGSAKNITSEYQTFILLSHLVKGLDTRQSCDMHESNSRSVD